MVDLVKIRKKAKKQKEAETAASGESPAASDPQSQDAAKAPEPLPGHEERPRETRPAEVVSTPSAAEAEEAGVPPSAEQGSDPASVPAPGTSKLDRFKAEAGRRREEESVRESEEHDSRMELLTFAIAGEQYAIDIEHIVEIVTPRTLTRIPNADPSVMGIVSLRGTIVTLVDVRRKLGHPGTTEHDDDTRIVVIDLRNEMIGFLVDEVLRVVKTSPEAVEPHPVVHAEELDESVRGVFRAGDALTILLDLDKLLDHSKLAVPTA